MPSDTGRLVILLAGIMFVVTVVGMVALIITGNDTAALQRLVGPLLTAVIVTGVLGVTAKRQEDRLDHQDKALQRITSQTNGVLDGRIKTGAKAAMLELAEDERAGRVSESGRGDR